METILNASADEYVLPEICELLSLLQRMVWNKGSQFAKRES